MEVVEIDGSAAGVPGRKLWLAGELAHPRRIAIVGARAARLRFREAVPAIVEAAREAGWAVVSGGALGIDGDVHRAALAAGVPQVMVLPCGADRVYPPAHAGLARQVAAAPHSGVLFAHPFGTAATRGMFASRNALVVGLASAVVVVQAAERSGTMATGRLALRRGVELAAIVGSAGAARLVTLGATALAPGPGLLRGTRAWLDGRATPVCASWPEHLRAVQTALAERGGAGVTIDDLSDPLSGLADLTEAETRGLVVEVAPGRYLGSGGSRPQG